MNNVRSTSLPGMTPHIFAAWSTTGTLPLPRSFFVAHSPLKIKAQLPGTRSSAKGVIGASISEGAVTVDEATSI